MIFDWSITKYSFIKHNFFKTFVVGVEEIYSLYTNGVGLDYTQCKWTVPRYTTTYPGMPPPHPPGQSVLIQVCPPHPPGQSVLIQVCPPPTHLGSLYFPIFFSFLLQVCFIKLCNFAEDVLEGKNETVSSDSVIFFFRSGE